MDTLLYFSYGSNMSTKRLLDRVPSAKVVSVAILYAHKLKFHKISKDGSAKCDAYKTDNPDDFIYGVIFEISSTEKPSLDRHEGLGNGYEEKKVTVTNENRIEYEAVTYYATNIDSSKKPYDWYKEHVLRGAREHGLPEEYIKEIEAIDSIPDPDNYENEMRIYR